MVQRFRKFELEKSINWELAIVKKINQFSTEIETKKDLNGIIEYKNIPDKKEFQELFSVGDIVYVKKIIDNKYDLKQLPKINGGIVVMDPYTEEF